MSITAFIENFVSHGPTADILHKAFINTLYITIFQTTVRFSGALIKYTSMEV